MGGKTNGSKERGVGETVAKESGSETIVKVMGVRETGGKATGVQVSQETGGKGEMLLSEREPDNSLPPSDKAAGQTVVGGDPSEELFRGSDRGGEKESKSVCGGLNS